MSGKKPLFICYTCGQANDSLALICHEEGKLMRLRPSRAICDENGRVQDVIAGTFFICYAPIESETFMSLPEDLEAEMKKKFDLPELIYETPDGIEAPKPPDERSGH